MAQSDVTPSTTPIANPARVRADASIAPLTDDAKRRLTEKLARDLGLTDR